MPGQARHDVWMDWGGALIVIWLRRLLPLSLGAVSALGFAPWDCWPLTLAGFAVWLLLIHGADTIRQVLGIGWLFGLFDWFQPITASGWLALEGLVFGAVFGVSISSCSR